MSTAIKIERSHWDRSARWRASFEVSEVLPVAPTFGAAAFGRTKTEAKANLLAAAAAALAATSRAPEVLVAQYHDRTASALLWADHCGGNYQILTCPGVPVPRERAGMTCVQSLDKARRLVRCHLAQLVFDAHSDDPHDVPEILTNEEDRHDFTRWAQAVQHMIEEGRAEAA